MSNKEENKKPKVHKDLKGMSVEINSFGEIKTNIDIDKINDFLNKNVEDKKLSDDQVTKKDKSDE